MPTLDEMVLANSVATRESSPASMRGQSTARSFPRTSATADLMALDTKVSEGAVEAAVTEAMVLSQELSEHRDSCANSP